LYHEYKVIFIQRRTFMLYTHDRAIILNDLANSYATKMRYTKAIERYREALALYIKLAKDKPIDYGLHIAHVFSNLSIIYFNLDKFKEAQMLHKNALKMHRLLVKQDIQSYGIGFASCIIEGVNYLNEHSIMLYEAELTLNQLFKDEKVIELLDDIAKIRKK